MATRRWCGGAAAKQQVQTYAFGGTWEVGDVVRVEIGTKVKDFTVASTTVATIVSDLADDWNELDSTDFPEFAEITASANGTTFTLTGDDPGKPFTATLTPLESNLAAADAQTIEGAGTATAGTTATAATGPNHWNNAQNWREEAVPVNGDDVEIEEGTSILYGLDQNAVALTSLRIGPGFPDSSEIGLPDNTSPTNPSNGYPEYRDRRLKLGATTVTIETVSSRVRLNLDTDATTVTVNGTGRAPSTLEAALDLVAVNAGNVIRINRGNVWLAANAGDAATFTEVDVAYLTNQEGDADVRLGRGLTLATLKQSGGSVLLECAVTTLVNKTGGTLTRKGTGAVATFRNKVGLVNDYGSGTVTALHQGGEYQHLGLAALTVTTLTVYEGSVTLSPHGAMTLTNAIVFSECHPAGPPGDPGPAPAWVNMGFGRNMTIA